MAVLATCLTTALAHPAALIGRTSISPRGLAQLPLKLVNNFQTDSPVHAYVTGLDPSGRPVILQTDGTFLYPQDGSDAASGAIKAPVALPLSVPGSTTTLTLPDFIFSARVYFVQGEIEFFALGGGINLVIPPQSTNWGFVELTNGAAGIYANISYVDFVGIVLGMSLQCPARAPQVTGGLQNDAVVRICGELKDQAVKDNRPWDKLCQDDDAGNPIRVFSPRDYAILDSSAFGDYWNAYVDQVWAHYSTTPLLINTGSDAGQVSCTVSGDLLNCAGDTRGFTKPSGNDIWGCNSGPFIVQADDTFIHARVIPVLCAAFNRGTLLLDGGNVQPALPSTSYYTISPSNHYSALVHKYEVDGKGYAFAYDDVNPSGGGDASGTVSCADPSDLIIYVGGPAPGLGAPASNSTEVKSRGRRSRVLS